MNDHPKSKAGGKGIWIIVAIGFGLLALAWTAMFFFASKYRAENVPIETR